LETLYLSDNRITNISPLAGLTKLRELSVGLHETGDIIDTSPLSRLTSLRLLTLSLYTNQTINYRYQAIDLSPLLRLTNLSSMYLDSTCMEV
jgi:Leucine-rich repeat (LRR) protein